MNTFAPFLFIFVGALFSSSAGADELRLSRSELRALGLKPVLNNRASGNIAYAEPARGTEWPIVFKSQAASIAQNYVQHQDYGTGQYYHGGCDLRTEPYSAARAPIAGKLEAGYYGYETASDGQDTKWWKPWDGKPTASLYFEIAVIDEAGYRYEMHHVNPLTLPSDIVALLNADLTKPGTAKVEAGRILAYVAKWPSEYDHVHFNLIRPDGLHMNPERYSVPVSDHEAPRIIGVYSVDAKGKVGELREGGRLPVGIRELVVATTESRDGNEYVQTPPYVFLIFSTGEKAGWDFRNWLGDATGKWVDIRNFFRDEIRTPSRKTIRNTGNYGVGQFLIRVPVPAGAAGSFRLSVGDTAGNLAEMTGILGSR